jgi:hypothetical protein
MGIKGLVTQNMLGRLALMAGLFCGTSIADTIGNPIVERTYIDTCDGCSFALSTPFTTAGELSTWSFYADTTGLSLTPLLYELTGGNFIISGIGTTVNVTSLGAQTYDFGLLQGTDFVDANTYFGYRDGTTTAGNPGTISIDNSNSGALMWYFHSVDPVVGANASAYEGGLLDRNYSLEADTTAAPEPSAWLMMLCGLGGLSLQIRRKL